MPVDLVVIDSAEREPVENLLESGKPATLDAALCKILRA